MTNKEVMRQALNALYSDNVIKISLAKTALMKALAQPEELKLQEAAPPAVTGVVDAAASPEFIKRTNDEYREWCKTHYAADALDTRGMASLHGLWAWQEQERRKARAQPPSSAQLPVPVPVRVTDAQNQFPTLSRALALWNLAPRNDTAYCWNAFVAVEVELEKLLNASYEAGVASADLRAALQETNSLLAAILHEKRSPGEISDQMVANRAAINQQVTAKRK